MHHLLQFAAEQEQHNCRSAGETNKYHKVSVQVRDLHREEMRMAGHRRIRIKRAHEACQFIASGDSQEPDAHHKRCKPAGCELVYH